MKRRLDQELENIHQDVEEMKNEANLAEDRSRHAMMDAAKLAEELRAEQEQTGRLDNERRLAEATIKELQVEIDDVENAAVKLIDAD
jgi:cell division septum initiation protein DivIVA